MEPPISHPSGMLWSLGIDANGARVAPEPDVEAKGPAGAWSWMHFPLGDVRARAFLGHVRDLPEAFSELLETRDERLQFQAADGWVFGVLPDMERDLSGKPLGAARLYFAADARRLITARLHALRVVDDVRREFQQGEAVERPILAVVRVIECYAELVEERVEALAERLDTVEDQVLSESDEVEDLRLSPLRREASKHRRELQSLRAAMLRTRSGRDSRRVAPLAEHLEPLIAFVEDIDRDAGNLQDRARLLHEEIDTLITSATNRSMRTLTVMSTLLIPPTLIVGAFGMNLEGIPFARTQAGFFLACVICCLVVAGAFVVLRRLRLLP